MIDAHSALRSHLIATSALRTLLGGDYVYWPEIPGTVTMPRKAISFRFSGGQSNPYLYAQQARVVFRCYGSTAIEAMSVYRALYDRLHLSQNFIVSTVGFYGAMEDVPGDPQEDPDTDWPFVHTVYTLWVATVAVA